MAAQPLACSDLLGRALGADGRAVVGPPWRTGDGPDGVFPAEAVLAIAVAGELGGFVARICDGLDGQAPPHLLAVGIRVEVPELRATLAAGALGYVTLQDGLDQLFAGLEAVTRGERYVSPQAGVALLRADQLAAERELDERDLMILELLARGYTNAEMAHELNYSVRTIETVRASLRQRLGLETRRDLVTCAVELGLVRSAYVDGFGGFGD